MRVILMSDVHGNLPALQTVAEHLPPHDRVIVAGDLCLEGPEPAQTLDLLRELGWELLLGNTDQDLVSPPPDTKPKKREVVEWTREQLGQERLSFLSSLPFARQVHDEGRERVLVVHANPRDLEHQLYPTMREEELVPYLADVTAEMLAFGHLHIPYLRPIHGVLLADVSSVGHPKDLDRRAGYTVASWENDTRSVHQVRVPYDIDRTVYLLRHCGMPHAEREAESLLRASY
ncbi:MAG: metallophosphoesterase family protein [Chloroflexota bacterium]